jgi:hypothetical protein
MEKSSTDRQGWRRWTVALMMTVVACSMLSFVADGSLALVLQAVMLVAIVGGVVSAWKAMPRNEAGAGPGRKLALGTAAVAAFAIAALVVSGLVGPTEPKNAVPETFDVTTSTEAAAAGQQRAMPVTYQTVDLSDEKVQTQVEEAATGYREIQGERSEQLISAAQNSAYETRSGLEPNWDEAKTQEFNGAELVSVPLLGTDLPEVTKVTFAHTSEGTSVVEFAGRTVDESRMQLEIWQDGIQAKNAVVELVDSSAGGVVQVFDFDEFADCLTESGVPTAIVGAISVACTVTCVVTAGFGCLVCAAALAGAYGGLVAGCIDRQI